MNLELVENILGVVKTSTDKLVILKALIKLRTDVVKNASGIQLFREAGGVAPMVRLLHKPHEKILEVALSILGNCCTDDACCKQAFEMKCVPPLSTILKSIPNPMIQCRACRLIGNLAKSDSVQLLAVHCATIAQSLCQIIVETSDVTTRVMGFRACRFLLTQPQFTKHFLQSNGFCTLLRILAAIMKNDQLEQMSADEQAAPLGLKKTQHREKYFEEVARNLECVRSDIFDHEVLKNSTSATSMYVMPTQIEALDLACEILKCLQALSELEITMPVWEAVTRSGCTFAPIVFFVTEENKRRSVALKILSNFTKNGGAFFVLSSSDAIVAACELLVSTSSRMEKKPLSETEKRHCINVITMLSPDACNRSKIRRSGALCKLIAMMHESKSHTEISAILHLLNCFQYDVMSMDLMLREGLITILIKELNEYLNSDDEYHKRRREERQQNFKKRKRIADATETAICKIAKKRDDTILDYDSSCSSPRSPASPCSSRSLSPLGGFKLDDTEDETYSPICSDDEDEDENNAADTGDSRHNSISEATNSNSQNQDYTANGDYLEIMKMLDIASRSETADDNIIFDKDDEDDISADASPKLPQIPNGDSTIDIIENLLFRATQSLNKRPELGKPETLRTLIKAVNLFGTHSNFAGLLTNVLLESQFFAAVIKQGIAHHLFQLTKVDEMHKDGYNFLETLTCVGESNYGKDVLARFLRSDDSLLQTRAAITVAYIIKNHRLLYQFLNAGNALTILFDTILRKKDDEYTAEAVDALTVMCQHTLNISLPQIDDTQSCADYEQYVEAIESEAGNRVATETVEEADDMCFMVHEQTNTVDIGNINQDNTPAVRVLFRKQLLCDVSEVFNTMLNGNFRESREAVIHLHGYTVSGLRYFLDLILRSVTHQKLCVPPLQHSNLLLEAFEMSRVYIIPKLESFMQQLLICMLDASNCFQVFEWSMKNYHSELTEMAINYYLCSQLSADVKVSLFQTADRSKYATEWFHMLIDAVFERCMSGF